MGGSIAIVLQRPKVPESNCFWSKFEMFENNNDASTFEYAVEVTLMKE
jgi:hypothetical protein